MKELVFQHWQYVVGYLAIGWLLGVALFYHVFMARDCSMGGNSGGQPLHYYKVALPSMPQAFIYVVGALVWPLTLVCILSWEFVEFLEYIMKSTNQVFPRVIKWVFGWPVLLVLLLCDECVDHEEN